MIGEKFMRDIEKTELKRLNLEHQQIQKLYREDG